MKQKKGGFSLVVGLLTLCSTLFLSVILILPLFGINHQLLLSVKSWLSLQFGFTTNPSVMALVPLTFLLALWTVMIFSYRNRKPFNLVLIPTTALMAYTLYTLSLMLQGSYKPLLVGRLLASSPDLRSASLKVVIAFLAETLLCVVLTLIGDALFKHKAKREAFEKRVQQARMEELGKVSAPIEEKNSKKLKKQKKSNESPLAVEEEETVILQKKPVAVEPEIQGDEQVSFPPIADVPELESLKKRRPVFHEKEADSIESVGKVSLGALHVLKEERKRNNGISILEQKRLDLEKQQAEDAVVEVKKPVQLSGFLQGALEAVGKSPSKLASIQKVEPKGKVNSILARAVEQQQLSVSEQEDPPLRVTERVLSVAYPKEEPTEPKVVSTPTIINYQHQGEVKTENPPKPKQEEPQPSFFTSHSTAKPINGGDIDEVVQSPVEEESDQLEEQSGVGGLSSREGGVDALISRAKLRYQYPDEAMLVTYPKAGDTIDEQTMQRGSLLVSTLEQFNVHVELTSIIRGPTVTMFELLPAPGVRVNSIVNLADNIALALAATQVRIVAPIPGKSAVGVEIPNRKRDIIGFREMLASLDEKIQGVPMVLGRNLMGEPIVMDVVKAPHLLIAGSTGSGKSVCVNSLICSILFKRSPKQVRLILVDPKIVELNIYNGIPHLLTPVITDAKRTLKALDFCLYEMDRRYRLLQGLNVRNIIGYNERIESSHIAREKLPYILVIIDEFADLMHTVGKDMESRVSRLAAMSRAVGIHLVLATQRPSADVITGVIKTNIPTRIAFAVTSAIDSRIILDEMGADKLLGKGDMLYSSATDPAPQRIQGSFLSDGEVEAVVQFVSSQGMPDFIDEAFFEDEERSSGGMSEEGLDANDDDELMRRALEIVVERKCASASYLQRRLKIGYNRAARLVEQMEELGYVGPPNGSKPRELIKYP